MINSGSVSSKKTKPWFAQSLRLLMHELRRGELTIVFLAIVLAVATVFSLTGFSNQIQQALLANSTNTIAADRVLRTNRVVDEEVLVKSRALSLVMAEKIETESMAFYQDNMLLSSLAAVSETYPLKGELKVQKTLNTNDVSIVKAPAKGTVWVESSLLGRLQTNLGEIIEIGASKFEIAGIITEIPDRSYQAFIAGPTILLNLEDMEKTGLILPGSRITYKYLFAGEQSDIKAFSRWLKPQLNETQSWYDAKKAQNRLSNILENAEKFLSLASMLGIVLAAVAVSVASRRYSQRHASTVAVFKALGATQSHINKLYCLHWGLLSFISIIVGVVIGYALMMMGLLAIESYLSLKDTQLTLLPFYTAIFTGVLCSTAFALQPLSTLIKTSPLNVIRGFSVAKVHKFSLHQLIPLSALFILLMVFSGNVMLSLSLLIGGIIVSAVLLFFGQILMRTGRSVGTKAGKSWHLALANLQRRASENSVQLVSFTIAIKLLLLITVIKTSMLAEWLQQFPEDTPNHYLINITEPEVKFLSEYASDNAIANQGFYHTYRGRLSAINNEATIRLPNNENNDAQHAENEGEENTQVGRRGAGRELGLTWREELPLGNDLIEGEWWTPEDLTKQVSIESRMAERLEIKLGDLLTFDLGSDSFTVPVTSIREVNWQNRQLNFIMIFNEATLKNFDTTAITAWMIPDSEKKFVYKFLSQFSTLTIIDFGAIMKQLDEIISQVSIAIELILILVVLAGSLVLIAQVQASMEERERELAILRTLGAKGTILRNSILFEFVALGAIAGFMASVGMEIAVYFLQTEVFKMSASFHFEYWLLGVGVGAVFVGFIGMMSCWRLLKLSSVTLIRRTM